MELPIEPPSTHASPAIRMPWPRRLRMSRAANWFAALLFVALPFIAANAVLQLLMPEADLRDVRNLLKAMVLVAAYWGYVRFWERRPASEFSTAGAWRETLAGLLLGAALFSAIVAVLAASGAYSVQGAGSVRDFAAVVARMLPKIASGALIEEVVFRLLLLRLLERSFGMAWALAISSLVFGLAHLGNAGATPLIAIGLGVEMGLLLGAAYLATRRIWFCAAVHFAWNFVQGAVFSIAVSGHAGEGWLHSSLDGPAWLTGGAFGAEGSIVAVVLCLAATAALLRRLPRRA